MEHTFLIAQIFGLLALIVSIISIPQKTKNRYIYYYIAQNVFSGVQYILLSKVIAFYLCIICIFRLIVYKFRNNYSRQANIFILIFFITLNLIISIITFEVWYDLFPLIASTLVCYTIWQEKILIIRIGAIMCKLLWGIYAVISLAYFSVVMDIIIIVWTIYIIIKNYRKNKSMKI